MMCVRRHGWVVCVLFLLVTHGWTSHVEAFAPPFGCPATTTTELSTRATRRQVLARVTLLTGTTLMINRSTPSHASVTTAVDRLRQARASLNELLQNYDTIAQQGGDNIRRYLGTVGTTSGLVGIDKVFRELQDSIDVDIVEFIETKADFEYYLQAADTAAYSSIFVDYSSAKGKPEDYYKEAKKAIVQMDQTLTKIMQLLELE